MKHKRRYGFTLVEIITVLVIVAILAAVTIPSMIGFVEKARNRRYLTDARLVLTATQARMTEEYAKYGIPGSKDVSVGSSNGDVILIGTPIAKDIIAKLDYEPYMCIIGMGKYDTYASPGHEDTAHLAYQVCFIAYWAKKDEKPLFFNGSEWMDTYPWKGTGKNTFMINGEPRELQFYFISAPNKTNTTSNWNELKRKVGVK